METKVIGGGSRNTIWLTCKLDKGTVTMSLITSGSYLPGGSFLADTNLFEAWWWSLKEGNWINVVRHQRLVAQLGKELTDATRLMQPRWQMAKHEDYVHRYVMTTRVKDVADKDMLDADAEPMLLARVIKNWTTLYRYIAMKGQWVTTAERRVLYSVDRQTERVTN